MSAKWAMFVDVALCHNCRNCWVACKDEHVGNDYPGYAAPQPKHDHEWIAIRTVERGQAPMVDVAHLPVMCMNCEDAPCMKGQEDGAVYRRPDGIVIIDPAKAKGQKEIVSSCPYGAVSWNEELELPQKWYFDAHLLDRGWKEPRCVEVCPTAAMTSAKLDDGELARKVATEGWEPLRPEYGTKPRVLYRNLHRYEKAFIGGTLVSAAGGAMDCVEVARIELHQGGRVVASSTSDGFGEFKLDGLVPDSGDCELRVTGPGCKPLRMALQLAKSRYLGELVLEAA